MWKCARNRTWKCAGYQLTLALIFAFAAPAAVPLAVEASPLQSVPDTVSYGQVPVSRSRERSLTLVNRGTEALFVDSVVAVGSFDLPADPLTSTALFLPAADSLTVAVRFSPSVAGSDSGGLRIQMTDLSGIPLPELLVPLFGTGTDIVIDEVLADPGSGLSGDANGDGTRQTYADEFVELLNRGPEAVDLGGWRLGDDDAAAVSWFEFPPLTWLLGGSRAVLFGGGTPQGFADPATIFTDDGRIGNGLSNGGDGLFLIDADGDTASIVASDLSWNSDQSVTRYPSGHGPFVAHSAPPGDGRLHSPQTARSVVDSIRLIPADTTIVEGQQFDLQWTIFWSDGQIDQPPLPLDSFATATSSSVDVAQVDGAGRVSAGAPGEAAITGSFMTVVSQPLLLLVVPESPGARCVVISEVLADPPVGLAGDANRDSLRMTYADEFIELFNPGADTISIAGWSLGDDDVAAGSLFRFPPGTVLPPGGFVVLFGGGTPQGFDAAFIDDGRIGNGLTNGGDVIILRHALGDTIDLYVGGNWPAGRSMNRWPQECKEADNGGPCGFIPHDSPAEGDLFSPGVGRVPPAPPPPQFVSSPLLRARVGTPYRYEIELAPSDDDGAVTVGLDEGPNWLQLDSLSLSGMPAAIVTADSSDPWPSSHPVILRAAGGGAATTQSFLILVAAKPDLAISEILADPPAGAAGDANGDGVANRSADEFIELYNRGAAVDLSGWRLSDDDTSPSRQFLFPEGTVLLPQQHLVLFGGGEPALSGRPALSGGMVFTDDGRIGNGLTNGGDRILLIAAAPTDTIIDITYRAPSNIDQSLVLAADGSWGRHSELPGVGLMSPGAARPEYASFSIDTLEVVSGSTFAAPDVHGIEPDGALQLIPGELITWVSYDGRILRFEAGHRQPVAMASGTARIAAWRGELPLAQGIIRVRRRLNLDPFIVSAPDTLGYGGGHYRYEVKAVDPEGDKLRYRMPRAPQWLKIDRASGLVAGTIPHVSGEEFTVELQVVEGGRSASQHFVLRVVDQPRVQIVEILTDPPSGLAGDANGNGRRESFGDEFVEIYNAEEADVDIGGWLLSDGDVPSSKQFRFPAGTIIAAGGRAVLFGAGGPGTPGDFFDDGRIGDGLANRVEEILLVAPSGPDTIDQVSIALKKEPDQSLLLPDLTPHGSFPGRGPFSPGRQRPILESGRISPSRLALVEGDQQLLNVLLTFSDGFRPSVTGTVSWVRESGLQLQWLTTNGSMVAVDTDGTIAGIGVGEALVSATLGPLEFSPAAIEVRPKLEDLVLFSPRWSRMDMPRDHQILFSVDVAPASIIPRVAWFANGRSLKRDGPRLAITPASTFDRDGGSADTICVRITTAARMFGRSQSVQRSWILTDNSPPVVLSPADTSATIGTPFKMRVRVLDAEGDRLYYTLARGPAGMRIDRASGEITWLPTAADSVGSIDLLIHIRDARHAVTYNPTLRIEAAAAKRLDPSSATFEVDDLTARCYPNPSSGATAIAFFLRRVPQRAAAEISIYDVAGQPVRTRLRIDLSPGWSETTWNGRDNDGQYVAAGVYFFALQAPGEPELVGKLLRLK